MSDTQFTPGQIAPVEQCSSIGKCMSNAASYKQAATPSYSSREPSAKRIAEVALQHLEAARAKDIAAHERNLPAIENNKAIAERVTALMAEIGMPRSWSERDTKSRSRFPKTITVPAGWLGDLARNVKTEDGFAYATATYERLKAEYSRYAEEANAAHERAQALLEQEAAREKEARRTNIELVKIILRYSLDEDSDWSEVLEELRKKDQRLDLALAMQQVRGDWSEGPDAVRNALDRFTIASNEDKAIANDIIECLRDFEDGRVFRDTTWNYDRLFASVADVQLVADAKLAAQKSDGNL